MFIKVVEVCVPIGFLQEGQLNCEFQTFPNTETGWEVPFSE